MNKPKNYKEDRKNGGVHHPSRGTLMLTQTSYEGQLPPAEMMAKYNEIDPTFANRILTMAEKEQEHQHKEERRQNLGLLYSIVTGMIFAFSSVLIVCYLVYFCIEKGYDVAASTIAVGVIVGIAAVFLYRKRRADKKTVQQK